MIVGFNIPSFALKVMAHTNVFQSTFNVLLKKYRAPKTVFAGRSFWWWLWNSCISASKNLAGRTGSHAGKTVSHAGKCHVSTVKVKVRTVKGTVKEAVTVASVKVTVEVAVKVTVKLTVGSVDGKVSKGDGSGDSKCGRTNI